MVEISKICETQSEKIRADLEALSPAAQLRYIARLQGVSLAALARRSGIHYLRVERIMNERFAPRPEELDRIATVLGVGAPQ